MLLGEIHLRVSLWERRGYSDIQRLCSSSFNSFLRSPNSSDKAMDSLGLLLRFKEYRSWEKKVTHGASE